MFRTVLNEIQTLIEKGNGATESELKMIWNQLFNAISEKEERGKISIYQFAVDNREKMTDSMYEALCSIQGKGYLKFIAEVTYFEFVKYPNIGRKAWERFVELREEALKK